MLRYDFSLTEFYYETICLKNKENLNPKESKLRGTNFTYEKN